MSSIGTEPRASSKSMARNTMKCPSLKMRAIALLSQREHSRVELRRKLLSIQTKFRAKAAEFDASEADVDADASPTIQDGDGELDLLLDWLEAQGYLSEARFIDSRIHARAPRFGSLRIKQELAQHGLSLDAAALAELKVQEFDRAKAIWQRKFGRLGPMDVAARAKQQRFMIARGFAAETIRKLLRGEDQDDA